MANDSDFKKALDFILSAEGGFNNIPGDTGGATNCGISLRFLQGTGNYELGDLDGDGDIDIADIRLLDKKNVAPIYKKYFWDCFPMAEIPAQVAYVVFDVAVNSGQRTAAKLLQKALGVEADGNIGQQTLLALNCIDSAFNLADKMCQMRKTQYVSYAQHNASLQKFLNGWLNRVDHVRKNLFEV
jgi:lysozyme family protein